MCVESAFGQEGGVCTSLVLLDMVAVKQSVFADMMLGSARFAEKRLILLATKLVFDTGFDNVLFHKLYSFLSKRPYKYRLFRLFGNMFRPLGVSPLKLGLL